MKLIAFAVNGEKFFGGVTGDLQLAVDFSQVRKARGAEFPAPGSLQELIEQGEEGLEAARADLSWVESNTSAAGVYPLSEVRLLAPTGIPLKLRCFSVYKGHMENAVNAVLNDKLGRMAALLRATGLVKVPKGLIETPLYYKGNNASVTGPDDEILTPSTTERMDYEMELAVILKSGGLNIKPEDAMQHVFGYTIFNDFSARDLMAKEVMSRRGPLKGKDFATSNTLGPWVVTADEIPDPYNLKATVKVNGVVKGTSKTSLMSQIIDAQIAEASRHENVIAGEVIGTGCMPDGCGFERLEFLKPGDLVEIEMEKIGTLRNRISQHYC